MKITRVSKTKIMLFSHIHNSGIEVYNFIRVIYYQWNVFTFIIMK